MTILRPLQLLQNIFVRVYRVASDRYHEVLSLRPTHVAESRAVSLVFILFALPFLFCFANTQHHPPYVYYCVRAVFRLCESYVTIRADTVDIRFGRVSFLPRIIYYYDYYYCNILCMRTHARTG